MAHEFPLLRSFSVSSLPGDTHVCSQRCPFHVGDSFVWCLVSGDVHICAFGGCLRHLTRGERSSSAPASPSQTPSSPIGGTAKNAQALLVSSQEPHAWGCRLTGRHFVHRNTSPTDGTDNLVPWSWTHEQTMLHQDPLSMNYVKLLRSGLHEKTWASFLEALDENSVQPELSAWRTVQKNCAAATNATGMHSATSHRARKTHAPKRALPRKRVSVRTVRITRGELRPAAESRVHESPIRRSRSRSFSVGSWDDSASETGSDLEPDESDQKFARPPTTTRTHDAELQAWNRSHASLVESLEACAMVSSTRSHDQNQDAAWKVRQKLLHSVFNDTLTTLIFSQTRRQYVPTEPAAHKAKKAPVRDMPPPGPRDAQPPRPAPLTLPVSPGAAPQVVFAPPSPIFRGGAVVWPWLKTTRGQAKPTAVLSLPVFSPVAFDAAKTPLPAPVSRKRKRVLAPSSRRMALLCGDLPARELCLEDRKLISARKWKKLADACITLWHYFCQRMQTFVDQHEYSFKKHALLCLYHATFGIAVRSDTPKGRIQLVPVVKQLRRVLPYLSDLQEFQISLSETTTAHDVFLSLCGEVTKDIGPFFVGPDQTAI